MQKTFIVLLGMIIGSGLYACTQNQRARNWGGTSTETLPSGQKLMVATWKTDDLWILTRNMKAGETPETYIFKEYSSFGLMNGTVVIQESQ